MLRLSLVVAIVFVLLLIVEYLWRVKHYQTEFTRKFIHMSVGSFAAFWPLFLSWRQIQLLSLLFLLVILASRTITALGSIHIIGRKTVGEIFFAISLGAVALITHNSLVYVIAILHLSLADGLAAIVGTHFGKKQAYSIFGQRKTVVGSLTFYLCSLFLIGLYLSLSHSSQVFPLIIYLPLLTTLLENIGIRGSDNLLVPVLVATILRAL